MISTALLVAFCIGAATATPVNQFDWRIVGGTVAAPKQFPYIFSLRGSSNSHNCGGSIISENWAITAAHCVSGDVSSFTLFAGINQLDDPNAVQLKLSQVIIHPEYDPWYIQNDIALLKLSEPVHFNDRIRPIKLQRYNFDDSRHVIVAGWGRTGAGLPIPNDLLFLNSKTIPNEECEAAWSGINPVVPTQICTLTEIGEGACNGDSGGPLICDERYNGGEASLCGLVSWGNPCAKGKPDVFTRVFSYYDWIQDTIQ